MVLQHFVSMKENFIQSPRELVLDLSSVENGLSQFDEFIVLRRDEGITIYDRICDHNAGKLITQGNRIICPMHGWELNPSTGEYVNVEERKKPLYEGIMPSSKKIKVFLQNTERRLPQFSRVSNFTIRFLNHACLVVESDDIKFATDPWIFGPAFCTGWWLQFASPADAVEQLNSCDFIYISHNHPDHLHRETLARIDRAIPIITPAFTSGSTEIYLRGLGFTNVNAVELGTSLVDHKNEIAFTLVKSGDFRDDSGLYFQIGSFTGLLTVDCKFIDSYRFNSDISFQASSFAGGASGFPFCFKNYSIAEQKRMGARNRSSAIATNLKMLNLSKPKYFMPYAGFFVESAYRDKEIYELNKKNSVGSYSLACEENDIYLMDVLVSDTYEFKGKELVSRWQSEAKKMPNANSSSYIKSFKEKYSYIDEEVIISYFENSDFNDNLDLKINLTDDDFITLETYSIRFFVNKKCVASKGELLRRKNVRYLEINVRKEVFNCVIRERLPWEDISIGFQCRIYREPNVYNSEFWYHFTNIYVSERANVAARSCGPCKILEQKF